MKPGALKPLPYVALMVHEHVVEELIKVSQGLECLKMYSLIKGVTSLSSC